jgi:hypothetical protein
VRNGINDGLIDRNCGKLRLLGPSAIGFPVLQTVKERGFTKEGPGSTNLFGDWSSEILVKRWCSTILVLTGRHQELHEPKISVREYPLRIRGEEEKPWKREEEFAVAADDGPSFSSSATAAFTTNSA